MMELSIILLSEADSVVDPCWHHVPPLYQPVVVHVLFNVRIVDVIEAIKVQGEMKRFCPSSPYSSTFLLSVSFVLFLRAP